MLLRTFAAVATFSVIFAVPEAHADDLYRVRPGEVYNPSTYCNWNRTGLPAAQQKICSDLDKKNGVYVPKWQTIEASNGATYKIDLNSIGHYNNGNAEIVVYAVEGNTFNPMNMSRLIFDCQGHHYMDTGHFGTWLYAPPRSMAGQIEAFACAGAKDTRLEDASKGDDQRGLSPVEYCVGFSPEACDRMKKVVETKIRPVFCKPGFAIVGSGLTSEQLRICYVMTSAAFH